MDCRLEGREHHGVGILLSSSLVPLFLCQHQGHSRMAGILPNTHPLPSREPKVLPLLCPPLSTIWEKKAHKHKLFALVNGQMALGQTAGCPRVDRAKKFMCSPRNTGNIDFSLWLTGGLSQGCPDFQKVYVFKVYVPFSCPIQSTPKTISASSNMKIDDLQNVNWQPPI